MENLIVKDTISSIELVNEINLFRREEGKKSELKHNDLLKVIRDEFDCEINEGKISPVEYKDAKGEMRPMFVLSLSQSKQVLVRESKFVRKAVIAYIDKLEDEVNKRKNEQKPLSMAEMFALQANINLEQERRVKQLESRLDAIEKERKENTAILFSVHTSTEKIPELSMRDNIRQLVNSYSSSKNVSQRDVWHSIYSQLYYLYHISIRNYKKLKGETNLDVAEKNNFLDKIFNIISNMVRELK